MFIDPWGLAAVWIRAWYENKLTYMQDAYGDAGGTLNWDDKTKTASVRMSSNGRNGFASFTNGVKGTFIKNDLMYVEESLLWDAFRSVIDPPIEVKSGWKAATEVLEEIPITNYFEAAIGRDLSGNKLNSTQRGNKLQVAVNQGIDAILNSYMLADVQVVSGHSMYSPNQMAVIELAKEAKKKGITSSEADILLKWADEYGVANHGPEIHPNRPGAESNVLHFHIGKTGHIVINP